MRDPQLDLKERIKKYWEEEVCGSRYGDTEDDRIRYFQKIEQWRYNLEPAICDFAEFKEYRRKRILEIGVGIGTDFINWVRNQANAVGIDFSESAIKLVKQRLFLEGINTGHFSLCLADAEAIPFKDNTFELVYAWGSLHHTPNIEKAIREIYRVLKPSGVIKVMIYHTPSWTGWMLWFRFCLLRLKPWISSRQAISKYLESPLTKAYTSIEARKLFEDSNFQEIETKTLLGPGDLLLIRPSKKYQSFIYRIIWLIYPRRLIRLLGSRFGLELLLQAKK